MGLNQSVKSVSLCFFADVQVVPGGFFVKADQLDLGGFIIPKQNQRYFRVFDAYYQYLTSKTTIATPSAIRQPFFVFHDPHSTFDDESDSRLTPVTKIDYYR